MNWETIWPVLKPGGWVPILLLAIMATFAWSLIVPSDWTLGPDLAVPNFWWQLGAVASLSTLTVFCGWLQGILQWTPSEKEIGHPPEPAPMASVDASQSGTHRQPGGDVSGMVGIARLAVGLRFFHVVSLGKWRSIRGYSQQRLRDKGYDVFLDRYEYAMSDDWIKEGRRALRNTNRLIVIATRKAISQSKPVAREIENFTKHSKHVISIVFGPRFTNADRSQFPILNRIPDSQLQVRRPQPSIVVPLHTPSTN